MAVTLDPTPAGPSANTYGSLAEALAYFNARLGGDAFINASSDDVRKRALIAAAYRIDQETYRGRRATQEQALEWPRVNTFLSGFPLPTDQIPNFVKSAQFEQALAFIVAAGADEDQDPMASSGTDNLKQLDVGDISLVFRDPANVDGTRMADDPSVTLAPAAYRILRNYIITQSVQTSPGLRNFPIYRG